MQLSAANLLLAAQQAPRPAGFASTLAAQTRKDELFAPLDFKQATPTAQPMPQVRPAPAEAPIRAGATLDIRV